jgi:predicted metal-dependent hydrolase|nr:MAG TPA: hypothetical protein [Caudoviricetes sp.]
MLYVKNTMNLVEKQALEVAQMDISQQATEQELQDAKLDYIAMMADIDLSEIASEPEEEELNHEQEI